MKANTTSVLGENLQPGTHNIEVAAVAMETENRFYIGR